MDYDLDLLKEAFEVTLKIDMEYRRAGFNEKVKLKKARDDAFNAFSLARLKLLEDGVICTPEDLKKMKELHQQIATVTSGSPLSIANLASFVNPVGGFVGLMMKFVQK